MFPVVVIGLFVGFGVSFWVFAWFAVLSLCFWVIYTSGFLFGFVALRFVWLIWLWLLLFWFVRFTWFDWVGWLLLCLFWGSCFVCFVYIAASFARVGY